MKTTAVITVLLAASVSVFAETQQDSPLVQAAKRTAEARRKPAATVITNATVANSKGVLSTSNGGAPVPAYTPRNANSSSTPAPVARGAAQPASGRVADSYSILAATNARLPQPSQNTTGGMTAVAAQNSGYTPPAVQGTSYAPVRSSAALPPAATNSRTLAESQNSGANRSNRP